MTAEGAPERATDLYIDVKVYGGAHIPDVIGQMVALADRIGISVWAGLNDVRTLARPGDNADEIRKEWQAALTRDYKIASDRTRAALRRDAK